MLLPLSFLSPTPPMYVEFSFPHPMHYPELPRLLLSIPRPHCPLYCFNLTLFLPIEFPSSFALHLPLRTPCTFNSPFLFFRVPYTPVLCNASPQCIPLFVIFPFLLFPCCKYFSKQSVVTMCLQFDALGGTSMKPRSKRAPHSKRLSIKDLALELAKKHVSFFLRLRASKIHGYTVRVPYPLSLARPVYIALSLVFRLNQRLPTVTIYLISLTLIMAFISG